MDALIQFAHKSDNFQSKWKTINQISLYVFINLFDTIIFTFKSFNSAQSDLKI